MKILLVKLKNLHTSACLQLNYSTKKQTKNAKVANIVELIKTSDQTLVNFGNFFNYNCNFYPLFLLRKKYLQKMLLWWNGQSQSVWEIMTKTWGEFCLGAWVKLNRFNFSTHKCICSSLNTINLKLFPKQCEIYRFRRKFKKDSGDIKPLGVDRNMIIDNRQYICLLFCWFWPKGWDNFQKREDSKKCEDWFWNRGYRPLCTLSISWYLFWLPLGDKT